MSKPLGFTVRPSPDDKVRHKAGVARRVEELGALDERHTRYLTAGDAGKLRELAAEYAARGMSATARQIQLEAEGVS